MSKLLSLRESIEINETAEILDFNYPGFDEDVANKTQGYKIRWNPVSGNTVVALYDEADQHLVSIEFDDADIAIGFLEEMFELDDEELAWLEDYGWVEETKDDVPATTDDNLEDRVINTLSDDGTSE